VEVGFTTLWGRLHAMLDAAFVPEEEKYKLVREGVFHVTFLDRLIIKEINGVRTTKYGHTYEMDPKVKMLLCTWGEGCQCTIYGTHTGHYCYRSVTVTGPGL
jgi:hypothetical protein